MALYMGVETSKNFLPKNTEKNIRLFFVETEKLRPGENLYAILGSKRKNAAAFADLMRNEGM